MKVLRFTLLLLLALLAAAPARAQLTVELNVKRRMFIAHEPILATVTIRNLSGRDIVLEDTPQMQWFGFQINAKNEQFITPRNPNYALEPLVLKSGETRRRTVNLTQLYEIGDYGIYRIRANIHFADLRKFFSSPSLAIEVTEGQRVWKQTVGVPGTDEMRTYELLGHQQGEHTIMYIRVTDDMHVYATHELGRMLEGQRPQVEFDQGNNLCILQLIGNREYVLTRVSPKGQFISQHKYDAPKSRPYLRRLADGQIQLVNGRRQDLAAADAPNPDAAPAAKLSDRPAGLPAK